MCFNKEMRGKIMNYIYDYISEERKKEIADMNIVDTYNRTGYLDIPGDKVVKSKDEYFLFWYNSPDTLCLRQQIEEIGSSSIGKKDICSYMVINIWISRYLMRILEQNMNILIIIRDLTKIRKK
jgi:hypothetical protein